jgi:hypothetical protein
LWNQSGSGNRENGIGLGNREKPPPASPMLISTRRIQVILPVKIIQLLQTAYSQSKVGFKKRFVHNKVGSLIQKILSSIERTKDTFRFVLRKQNDD